MPDKLSIVVPVLDEAESLPTLYEEITAVGRQHGYDLEVIFIDDGSRDTSWQVIQKLAASDARVRGIRFRRTSARRPR